APSKRDADPGVATNVTLWPFNASSPAIDCPSDPAPTIDKDVACPALLITHHSSLFRQQVPNRLDYGRDVGQECLFQGWAVGHGSVRAVQPAYRRVEIVEAAIHDLGRDLGADRARRIGLVRDEQTAGLVN